MTFNFLVLCTGNSARSILGEMLFNHLGEGRVKAWSAGSRPGGTVNPLAIDVLAQHGIPSAGARSKSWDEFGPSAMPPAPPFDAVFTVCASAAGETCPLWPGQPVTVHWAIPDPAAVEPAQARRAAFEAAYRSLRARIEALLALPLEAMSRDEVLSAARTIHEGVGHVRGG